MFRLLYCLYQLVIVLPVLFVTTLLTSVSTSLGCMFGDATFWSYWPGRLWSASLCRLLWLPVHVEGREHLQSGQSYVFVSNHQGAFDIFLVYGFLHRPFKWMLKQSLRRVPMVGLACEKAGFTFVDKSSPRAVAKTMIQARESLRDGSSMVIFPEGSRTYTGQVGEFKRGAFQLATQFRLPICPLTIDGSFEVLPRQRGFGFVTRHALRLVIHEPITDIGKSPEAIGQAMQQCRDTIVSALPPQHQDPA